MAARHRPLNVLVLAACTSHKGGLEVMCLRVAQEMKRRDNNIILAYRDEGDAYGMFQEIASVSYKIRLGPLGFRNVPSSLRLLAKLTTIVKRHRIDVCFASNTGLGRTTGVLSWLTGVAVVYHFGAFYLTPPDLLNRWGLRRSSAAIAPSSKVADTWRRAGVPAEKLEVCPNWTDTGRFRSRTLQERLQIRRRFDIATDIPLILYVGRLCASKGIYTLLDAVKMLNRSNLKPAVALVGALDPSEARDFNLARDGVSSPLHIVGLVNNPEDYFAIADIVVVPALGPEAFGMTLIEAMSCEVVTVASKADSIPEILGPENCDLLFARGSAEECAQRLRTWLSKDAAEREARGRRLRQRVLREYAQDNATFYEEVFRRVAADKAARQIVSQQC